MDKIISLNDYKNHYDNNYSKIYVDTNILLFWFYGNVSYIQGELSNKKTAYQDMLKFFVEHNTTIKLATGAVNIAEAIHVIEKIECDIYNSSIKTNFTLKLKDYRSAIDNREKLQKIFKIFYRQIALVANIEDFLFTKKLMNNYIRTYRDLNCDALDYALIDCAQENAGTYIITDDIDFVGQNMGLDILTANKRAVV